MLLKHASKLTAKKNNLVLMAKYGKAVPPIDLLIGGTARLRI